MKKVFILFCALVASASSFAQAVANGDMELWRTGTAGTTNIMTVEAPQLWYGADSLFIGLGQSFGLALGIPDTAWNRQLFKESVIVHGGTNSAKMLTTFQDTLLMPGVVSNAKANVSITIVPKPSISGITYSGGMPVTVKPITVSAWVQYEAGIDTFTHTVGLDSGSMSVQAIHQIGTKDSIIGTGSVNIGPTAGGWVQITANISYPVDTTDSVNLLRITFASSGGGLTLPCDSSTLYVDDVTMTSVPNPIPIDHTAVRYIGSGAQIFVYPNPANNMVFVDGLLSAGCRFSMLSVTGSNVLSAELKGNDKVDISSMSPGLYLYRISDIAGNVLQRGKISVSR